MAHKAKDVFEATSTREKATGFVTALFLFVFILTAVDFLGAIEFRSISRESWFSPDETRHVLGFPSYTNPEYKLFVKSIGEFAGSVVVTGEKVGGWKYNGTFYLGDTVLLGNWRVTIKDINMDRESPILLERYQLLDLRALLVVGLVALGAVTIYAWKK